MATDALIDLLRTVRLTGAAYFEITAQAPWSVRSPAADDAAAHLQRRSPDRLSCGHAGPLPSPAWVGGEPCWSRRAKSSSSHNADRSDVEQCRMRAEAPSADMIEIASAGGWAVPDQPDE